MEMLYAAISNAHSRSLQKLKYSMTACIKAISFISTGRAEVYIGVRTERSSGISSKVGVNHSASCILPQI